MKNRVLSIITLLVAVQCTAADHVVDINGGGGAFSSIQSAVDAAAPGDRLLIVPGGVPFSENVIINKSISLLSQVEGQRFNMQGNIHINTNNTLPGGSVVTIMGAHLLAGDIHMINQPTGQRVKLNVMNCKLSDGKINGNVDNIDLKAHHDSLMNGRISLRYGSVVGCYLKMWYSGNDFGLYVGNDNQPSNEPIYIVGNKIVGDDHYSGSFADHLVYLTTGNHYVRMHNNYIKTIHPNQYGLYVFTSKNGTGENHISNNTFEHGNNNYWAVVVSSLSSPTVVHNNLFCGTGAYGWYSTANASQYNFSYNHFNASYISPLSGLTNNGLNVTGASNTINPEGKALTGSAVDGGNPDFAHWDLDNTLNDAGCFGGSWSRENFLSAATGSRTSWVVAPTRITSGANIQIQGYGFDK